MSLEGTHTPVQCSFHCYIYRAEVLLPSVIK